MIHLAGIHKTFRVAVRKKGVGSAVKSMFKREYKTIEAVRDLSFDIAQGEIVGYIGPNGAGKSTSIKIMSGILVPDEGACEIMGMNPWRERSRYVAHIGIVFGQRTQLWWDVPVQDSYELLKDIYRIPSSAYKRNVELLTETMQLQELLQTPLRQLSLGQRMRCELAASLLHDPEVLFLDEPTIGLDAVSKLAVRDFIKRINAEKRTTIILTTHDMHDIEALTDRLILIGHGQKVYDGRLAELNHRVSPVKRIAIDYSGKTADVTEVAGLTLVSEGDGRATYEADIGALSVSDCMEILARAYEIEDMSFQNVPIEEVVAGFYTENSL